MLKRTFATLLFTLLIADFAAGFPQGKPGPVGPAPWRKFSSAEGRFNILMPVAPKVSSREAEGPAGKLTLHVYDASNSRGYFAVTYADYPGAARDPAHAEQVLDGVRTGVLRGVKGELISEKKISLKGHPGREFKASGKVQGIDVVFTWRIYLVGQRLYQLAVGAQAKDAAHPDVAKFLTSFDLTPLKSASR